MPAATWGVPASPLPRAPRNTSSAMGVAQRGTVRSAAADAAAGVPGGVPRGAAGDLRGSALTAATCMLWAHTWGGWDCEAGMQGSSERRARAHTDPHLQMRSPRTQAAAPLGGRPTTQAGPAHLGGSQLGLAHVVQQLLGQLAVGHQDVLDLRMVGSGWVDTVFLPVRQAAAAIELEV